MLLPAVINQSQSRLRQGNVLGVRYAGVLLVVTILSICHLTVCQIIKLSKKNRLLNLINYN
jgi:hypothetical protein